MKPALKNRMPENLPGAYHFNRAAIQRDLAASLRRFADIVSARLDKKWNNGTEKGAFNAMCNSNAYSAFNMAADPLQTRINDLRWKADMLSLKAAGHTVAGTVQKAASKLGL